MNSIKQLHILRNTISSALDRIWTVQEDLESSQDLSHCDRIEGHLVNLLEEIDELIDSLDQSLHSSRDQALDYDPYTSEDY